MTTEKRPLKVFLCHASQDKPVVRELSRRLVGEGWIDTWLDETKLLPGQDWRTSIEDAVETSDIVIICLSSYSVSKEGYVQKELRYAREIALEKPEDTIFIIPLRLGECEVPRGLRFYQWVDYFGEKKYESYKALIESLKLRREQKLKLEETERVRKEKLAREVAERNAREKAARDKVEREIAEKAARERLAWESAEKDRHEKAERELAEKTLKEWSERRELDKYPREKVGRENAPIDKPATTKFEIREPVRKEKTRPGNEFVSQQYNTLPKRSKANLSFAKLWERIKANPEELLFWGWRIMFIGLAFGYFVVGYLDLLIFPVLMIVLMEIFRYIKYR